MNKIRQINLEISQHIKLYGGNKYVTRITEETIIAGAEVDGYDLVESIKDIYGTSLDANTGDYADENTLKFKNDDHSLEVQVLSVNEIEE